MIVTNKFIEDDHLTLYYIIHKMKNSLLLKRKKLKKKAKIYKTLYKQKNSALQIFLENENKLITDYLNLLDKFIIYKSKYQIQKKIRLFSIFCDSENCTYIKLLVLKYIKIPKYYNMNFKYNYYNINIIKKINEIMGYPS